MLQTNCSESTTRLNVSKLSETEIENLQKELMKMIIDTQSDGNEKLEVNNRQLHEIKEDFYAKVYETNIMVEDIFGIKALTIHGDFPFNHREELDAFINEKELEFQHELE